MPSSPQTLLQGPGRSGGPQAAVQSLLPPRGFWNGGPGHAAWEAPEGKFWLSWSRLARKLVLEGASTLKEGGEMNTDRSVCVEGGKKPFYYVLLATERKCCDRT